MSRTGAFFKRGLSHTLVAERASLLRKISFPKCHIWRYVRTLFHNKLTSQIYSAEKLNEYQGPKVEVIITENNLNKWTFFSPPSKHRAQAYRSSRGRQLQSSRNLEQGQNTIFPVSLFANKREQLHFNPQPIHQNQAEDWVFFIF